MFDDHFEVFLADTQESKEINYSIRYQVYCEEMGFENKDDFPLEQEVDEYDEYSVHFIVRNKHTGQWIAAMRLILKNEKLLPIEKFCLLDFSRNNNDFEKAVEVSRICVVKEIRRRISDASPPHCVADNMKDILETDKVKLLNNHQRVNRSIIWGMLNAGSEYCNLNNISSWYSMTPTPLAKILQKGGFNMSKIGEPVYHKGERFPYKNDVFETFHYEAWRKDFKCGYSSYSELRLHKNWDVRAA